MQKIKTMFTERNERGFTLIELLVVIAIIAVLAALILAALASAQKGSRDSRRKSDLNQYKTGLGQYAGDNGGNYPAGATISATAIAGLTPTYMSTLPNDPKTAGAYKYNSAGSNKFCIVVPLEKTPAVGFEVTPTYSGTPAASGNSTGAPTAGTLDGSACVESD
jgi:prepilin-type N-terminal cleavage/methylation domain-containing protein